MGSIVSAVAPAVVGSLLSPKPKAPRVGQQTTTEQAPAYAQPMFEEAAGEAQRLFQTGQLGQYQTLSPIEQQAIQRGIGMAQAGAPLVPEAQRAAGQLLGGAGTFLAPAQQVFQRLAAAPATTSTEAFRGALESAISPAVQRATSQFARGGRLGSGLFGEALGRGISAAAAPAILAAQQADIQRQMEAGRGLADVGRLGIGALGTGVQAAPTVGALGFEDIQRQLQLGGLLSQEDLMRRQQEAQALREYEDLIRGATFGAQTTSPLYTAPRYSAGDIARGAIGGQLIQAGTSRLGDFLGGLGSTPPQAPTVSFGSGTGIPAINVPTYNEPLVDFSMFGGR